MNNMEIYNAFRATPKDAQKKITGGRLNGFTDINPMYRIKVLTEQFGPCGIGWYYEPTKKWTEQVGDELLCFVDINLYIKVDGEWSKPIHGTGGSALLTQESRGLRASDEGYKMATTDALSVACKQLGIGADIYWAKGETKYATDAAPETAPVTGGRKPMTKSEKLEQMQAVCARHGVEMALFGDLLQALQQDGKVVGKPTSSMTDAEFMIAVALVDEAMLKVRSAK